MITRIQAPRYRRFDKLDVGFRDFGVPAGADGWGKGTLVDILVLGDMFKARTIRDAFLRERDHRAPRAGVPEQIFQSGRDLFIVAVEEAGRAAAAVIEPEFDVLLWQDNVNVERALFHQGGSLCQLLAADGRWPEGAPELSAPKEVIQTLIGANRAGPQAVVYSQIAGAASTAGCVHPAFHRVRTALRAWFPAEVA